MAIKGINHKLRFFLNCRRSARKPPFLIKALLWVCNATEEKAIVVWRLNLGCSGPLCFDLLLFAVLGWCSLCFAWAFSVLTFCVGQARLCLRLSLAVTHGDYPGSLSPPPATQRKPPARHHNARVSIFPTYACSQANENTYSIHPANRSSVAQINCCELGPDE